MRGVMKWAALLALLTGCRPKPTPPPPPTVADLQFPVVVIFGKTSAVKFKDAADLGTMSMGSLNAVTGPPPLIDSSFAIYTLEKLGSTHGALWLMANPVGYTPVKFELARAPKSGIETARELMRLYLDDQTWRRDLEEMRRALAAERTLPGMFAIVRPESK
jgi:hypothetical protein